jgi:hypothetical protein
MPVFYDSHCHIMNLSHPNLMALLKRVFMDSVPRRLIWLFEHLGAIPLFLKILIWFLLFLPLLVVLLLVVPFVLFMLLLLLIPPAKASLVEKLKEKAAKITNLLAVMETEIGDCLIQLEEELRKQYETKGGLVLYGGSGEEVCDRIVMTPLVMDFGLKNYRNSKSPYKVRWKPVVSQVEDLCLGFRNYYLYRSAYIKSAEGPLPPLFEFHPFLGLNTVNYQLQSSPAREGHSSFLEDLLEKNFSGFECDTSPEMRRINLSKRDWSTFDGNIESIGPYDFAGIKVYPPLGFNPWPEEGDGYPDSSEMEREREKVLYLYDFCIGHNIPLTTHCNDGGFLVNNSYREFSSPEKWAKVLEQKVEYRALRLNLAHFGGAEREDWREMIAGLLLKYDNVYTDISYQGVDRKIYGRLKLLLDSYGADRDRLLKKIVFGSDFMINLQDIASYGKYLQYFAETDAFTLEEKGLLCHENAMRYLFLM